MKIALFGYGKMGKEIEKIAISRGHEISCIIDSPEDFTAKRDLINQSDVAIEFSIPESAIQNIMKCFDANLAVVVGTTGWHDQLNHIRKECEKRDQALFYASNFSIGVNLFFEMNRHLSKLMQNYNEYNVSMEETHHIHKLDSPSGTAITLANEIIETLGRKKKWVNEKTERQYELEIVSHRTDEVPGTHIVKYTSEVDDIEIKHLAHNRKGFALGAVVAAEWLAGKKGVFNMNDLLKIGSPSGSFQKA